MELIRPTITYTLIQSTLESDLLKLDLFYLHELHND